MTREEAIQRLTDIHKFSGLLGLETADKQTLSMGIDALDVEPCEDAISRKAVLEWIKGSLEQYANTYSNDMLNMWMLFEEQIKAMSPIQPKAKVGKWISIYGNVKCSICGNVKDGRSVGKATHYCDFCGAKMESEVKECR